MITEFPGYIKVLGHRVCVSHDEQNILNPEDFDVIVIYNENGIVVIKGADIVDVVVEHDGIRVYDQRVFDNEFIITQTAPWFECRNFRPHQTAGH